MTCGIKGEMSGMDEKRLATLNPKKKIKGNTHANQAHGSNGDHRMKTLILFWFCLGAFSLQAIGQDQIVEPVTGLPNTSSNAAPATDMYHYTDADEVELQAALNDFTQVQGEYQSLFSQYSVISFKALDSGPDGCRIEMDGGLDYYLYGYKGASDRY